MTRPPSLACTTSMPRAHRGPQAPQLDDVLVEAVERPAVAPALAEQVLLVAGEAVVPEGLGGADLLAHEEHGRARGEHGHAEGEPAARLRVAARVSHERRAAHGHDHRAR